MQVFREIHAFSNVTLQGFTTLTYDPILVSADFHTSSSSLVWSRKKNTARIKTPTLPGTCSLTLGKTHLQASVSLKDVGDITYFLCKMGIITGIAYSSHNGKIGRY